MRKHVKPADKAASIPDPARKTDLPPEGRVVDWSVHWARLEAREDIIVSDAPDEAEAETPSAEAAATDGTQQIVPAEKAAEQAPAQAPTESTTASVPFMITAASRKRLKALGKTDDEIAKMNPE